MNKDKQYRCEHCGTHRFLVFPKGDETLILCSGCHRMISDPDFEVYTSN